MTEEKPKKAKWSLAERAADIEQGKNWQRVQGSGLDSRAQTNRLPDAEAQRKAKRKSK